MIDVWNGKGPRHEDAEAAIRDASGGALDLTLDALSRLLVEDDVRECGE